MTRRIAHLDMDAFFVSVELLQYPELRGQPVVVGGRNVPTEGLGQGTGRFARLRDYVGRGVVTTSTYEARALGVYSGMGLMKSAQLAPEAILLPAHFEAYRHYSQLFKAAVATIVPAWEDRGVDEIYLDLTSIQEASAPLAQRIQQAVWQATGLTCSMGITPNKLLAKIASDLNKPNGVTILTEADVPTQIWPLPSRKINGIGPKAAQRLEQLGIYTIGELAQVPADVLVAHFGRHTGYWMHQAANGLDDSPVITESEPKSISRESTFDQDLHAKTDRAQLSQIFTGLCQRVAEDLQSKGYATRTIGIKIRYADFSALTRDVTVAVPVWDAASIRKAAGECLKRVPLSQRIRLLGVKASALIRIEELEPMLVSPQQQVFDF